MTALGKFSTLLLDVKHTRTQYDSLITQAKELTSDRGIDYRASDQRHREGLEGHALSSGEDFQQWKSRTLKPVLRFPFVSRGREGVENETYVLRFASFCELLRRPLKKGETGSVKGKTKSANFWQGKV